MDDNNTTTRRGFYSLAINGLNALIGAAVAIVAVPYLLFPKRHKTSAGWTEATDLSKLTAGTPAEVIFDRVRKDSWRTSNEKTSAWILKKSDQEVVAFGPSCTHLGCAYKWDELSKNFLCPCHTSAFSIDGKVLTGPAPRPLDRYDVRVDNGKILLGEIRKA